MAKIHEGLLIYNIDIQGNDLNFSFKKLNLRVFHIGDLKQGIGLNIGDAIDYVVSFDELNIKKHWKTDIRLGVYHEFGLNRYQGIKLSSGLYDSKGLRLYAQGAYSLGINSSFNLKKSNFSYLVGAAKTYEKNRLRLKSKVEYRFYGWRFNKGFRNLKPSYRESRNLQGSYGGTIGNTVYPLYAYDRPFSQWAVYTEYEAYNRNISSFSLTGDLSYRFFRSFFIDLSVDINHLMLQGHENFTYPFYTSKLTWELSKGHQFSLLLTNKGMNLDVNYPTHYLHKQMQYGFSFTRNLNL
ncbi:MAG: hypothetical protein AB8B74_14535 [Crocinitomicaceae bacterium]